MKHLPSLLLTILLPFTGWAQDPAPPSAPDPAPPVGPSAPALTPGQLYETISHVTKPLWRQLYRDHIERSVTEREKAAFSLGTVSADQALAAMARDGQQLRNLLQDEQAFEKMLSIVDKMATYRQKIQMFADQGDWPAVAKTVDKIHDRQLELLQGLRDHDLATLVGSGRWLRAWQTAAKIVISKKLTDGQLAIGSPELVQQTTASISAIIDHQPTPTKLMRHLAKRCTALDKLWRDPATAESLPARLSTTQEILDELMRTVSE